MKNSGACRPACGEARPGSGAKTSDDFHVEMHTAMMAMSKPRPLSAKRPSLTQYIARNWVFRLLVGNTYSLKKAAAWLAGWYAVLAAICAIDGSLWIDGGVGFFEDAVMYVLMPCLLGVVVTTRRVLVSLEHLLSQLPNLTKGADRVATARTGRRYADVVRNFVTRRSLAGSRTFRLLLLVMLVLVGVFQIAIPFVLPLNSPSWAIWPQRYRLTYVSATIWAVFYWCAIVGSALWYVFASSSVVRRVLKRYVSRDMLFIVPVAPDGKGGLLPLAEYSMSLTWVAACGLLFPLSWMLQFGATLSLALGLLAYLGALAVLLFAPMWAVHDAMRSARDRELDRLASLFRISHAELPDSARIDVIDRRKVLSDTATTVAYLAQLDQLHRRAEGMPVWPFDVATLGQFGALVVVPLLLFLAQTVSEEWIRSSLMGMFR